MGGSFIELWQRVGDSGLIGIDASYILILKRSVCVVSDDEQKKKKKKRYLFRR